MNSSLKQKHRPKAKDILCPTLRALMLKEASLWAEKRVESWDDADRHVWEKCYTIIRRRYNYAGFMLNSRRGDQRD